MVVLYSVYKVKFRTRLNTYREYVGFTGNATRREDKLGLGGVDWTKPLQKDTLQPMQLLHINIESKAVARCLEALCAAKATRR